MRNQLEGFYHAIYEFDLDSLLDEGFVYSRLFEYAKMLNLGDDSEIIDLISEITGHSREYLEGIGILEM